MTGAEIGGALGTALPLAVSGVVNSVRRAVSPFTINPERQALVDQLGNEGVRVTAGQATGSRGLRYAESEIGGQQAEDAMNNQGEQFTSAILRRVGVNADRATPTSLITPSPRTATNSTRSPRRTPLCPTASFLRTSSIIGGSICSSPHPASVLQSSRTPCAISTMP